MAKKKGGAVASADEPGGEGEATTSRHRKTLDEKLAEIRKSRDRAKADVEKFTRREAEILDAIEARAKEALEAVAKARALEQTRLPGT